MSRLVKSLLAATLVPVLRAVGRSYRPLRQLLSWVRTRARIRGNVDPSAVFHGTPEVNGTAQIHCGKNLFLYPELYLETRDAGTISIGDNVVMSRGVHVVSYTSIEIGVGTMIGEYCSIRDANHKFGEGKILRSSGHDTAPIRIGNNVWIARGVTILPGVTIGDNAVVGANAVVTKDVPADTVAVGLPAKPIPSRRPVEATA
ncbi:MAG: acyltransferase [Planctomycetota bacterium]